MRTWIRWFGLVTSAVVPLFFAPLASATDHLSAPFATWWENPCTGEVMYLEGQFDQVIASGITPSGVVHLAEAARIRMSGVSTSGVEYTYIQTSPDHIVWDTTDGAPLIGTGETSGLLLSRGRSPNFDQRMLFHLTIDANGDITAQIDDVRFGCTGQ